MNVPEGFLYTKDHEWVKIEGNTATVGITDFAQGELGDIVYIEIETLDEEVAQEEVFGPILSVIPFFGLTGSLTLSIPAAVLVFLLGLVMLYFAVLLYKKQSIKAARQLMLVSVSYITLLQIIFVIDKFTG